jgi:hypothetical protein
MEPVMDRHTEGPLGPSHQIFGYYSGTVTLDGGRKLSINKCFGFAEKNVCRWAFVENSIASLFSLATFFGRLFKKRG